MSRLLDLVRQRILQRGPLRFDAFQEMALYEPGLGYYEREGRVGPLGDFVTGASWHPAFARSLARIHVRLEEELGRPAALVDVGAGEGELLSGLAPVLPGRRLVGVERSATRRALGAGQAPGAEWYRCLKDVPPVVGTLHAYELFDALPVRTLRVRSDGRLAERLVGLGPRGQLRFVEGPCSDGEEVLASLAARGARLESGQLLEVRPGAGTLMRALASRLEKGLLLVFDYGAPTRALYGPAHRLGTLESFRAHTVSRRVLTGLGTRDLTAWVDFGELAEAAQQSGLEVAPLVSQSRVLLAAGILTELVSPEADGARPAAEESVRRNAIAKLVAPGGMGESLRVLLAGRGTALPGILAR